MIDTSNTMLFHIKNLNQKNDKVHYQMATGKVLEQGSDDSVLHAKVINIEDKLRVTEGLKSQVENTQALNEMSDDAIGDIKKSLEFIKIDLMKGLNAGMDSSDKLALSANLKGIRDTILDSANVQVDGEYLFTGSSTQKQTFVKDDDFKINGKVEFGGDGFLRQVAVQPGSYRDRGVTAYDVAFYTNTSATSGKELTFSAGERIIDENGYEWKLNENKDKLQKYDHNGIVTEPLKEISITNHTDAEETDGNKHSVQEKYTLTVPASPEGRLLEAKHNYFDDINVIINGLDGYSTKLDGTRGPKATDGLGTEILKTGLTQTVHQFDATNIGHGELGGRNYIFETSHDKLLVQETHYNILLQDTNGVDMAKLAMESKALELTYQALYSTIGKMNKLSLMDYIR